MAAHGTIEGETRNLSQGGIAIYCDEPLPIEEVYRISISPPDRPPLGVTGKVVWADRYGIEGEDTTVGMGVCFLEISEEDRQFLRDLVAAHLEQ